MTVGNGSSHTPTAIPEPAPRRNADGAMYQRKRDRKANPQNHPVRPAGEPPQRAATGTRTVQTA